MKVALITGCNDKHYQLSLLSGLVAHGVQVDFIANDDMIDAAAYKNVNYFNFRGDQDLRAPLHDKIRRILKYYVALLTYAAKSAPGVFHIQWLNRFEYFDRTVINIYYKALGKKLVFTAHNVNAGWRDGRDNLLNRWTLWFMYHLVDHIIVHTEKMKEELQREFRVPPRKVTVIPHGVHDAIPSTELTRAAARERLGIVQDDKVLLFFGNVRPYKGVEYLLEAFDYLKRNGCQARLIIAGRADVVDYWKKLERLIKEKNLEEAVLRYIGFIPDEEVEVFCKAADVMVIPYTHVFQSGILFVAYNFGVPVVVTDVGSLREEVIEGKTGFVAKPKDPLDLAAKIALFFESDLYKDVDGARTRIRAYAQKKYSWSEIGKQTIAVYESLAQPSPAEPSVSR